MNIKHLNLRHLVTYSIISVALITPISSTADILSLGSNPQILKSSNAPKMGMTMNAVLLKFGKPIKRATSPGKVTKQNPRITTWDYANSTVYFENTHVIHTVIHR